MIGDLTETTSFEDLATTAIHQNQKGIVESYFGKLYLQSDCLAPISLKIMSDLDILHEMSDTLQHCSEDKIKPNLRKFSGNIVPLKH